MRFGTVIVGLLLGTGMVVSAGRVDAQTGGGAKGFFLGAALNGSTLTINEGDLEDDSESGGGLMIQLGFGFSPQFSIFLEGSAAAMQSDGESWVFSHGDLGIRYHFFSPGRKFVPFIDGAFTGWSGLQDDAQFGAETGELEITGSGFTLGGGFLYYFTPRMALNTQLKYTAGEFNKVRFDNVTVEGFDADASSARLNIGLTWFLGAR
ncbi:MAG: outer membrane beta-barrel protein [Gemmatimonadota bacterium]